MDCETVRELYVAALTGSIAQTEATNHHIESCQACRTELRSLAATWAALGDLAPAEPSRAVGRRLRRRVRLEAAREALGSLARWQQGALTGVVGFVLSVLLSLAVPYDTMVAACRELAPTVLPTAGAYLVAGLLYGLVPMAAGAVLQARLRADGGVFGALEAVAVFVAVLLPYVLVLCGAFPPVLLLGFLGGISVGALVGSVGGTWIVRRPVTMGPAP